MKPIHDFLVGLCKKGYMEVTQWRNVLDEFEVREQKEKQAREKKIDELLEERSRMANLLFKKGVKNW